MPVTSLELATSAPRDTRELAAALAPLLLPGDVVALSGELGAGKTCFVQGAVRGLEVEARVTSPTFVLVRQYAGRLPVVHCDVYRLNRLQDVHELGDEVLAPDVVTFVEWADAVAPLLPDDRLEVELLLSEPDAAREPAALAGRPSEPPEETRTVVVRAFGARWADRATALAAAWRPWQVGPVTSSPHVDSAPRSGAELSSAEHGPGGRLDRSPGDR